MNIDFNNQSSIRKLEFFIKQKLDVFVKRPKKINKVNVSKDDNLTAKTNGKEITLGTRYLPKTENEKMVFFLGLATHEMSHILYTNFSIMKNIFYSEQDFFHYIKNQQLLDFDQSDYDILQEYIDMDCFRSLYNSVFDYDNILEDSYIERRFKTEWKDSKLAKALIWLDDYFFEVDNMSTREMLDRSEQNYSTVIRSMILDYALYKEIDVENLTKDESRIIAELIEPFKLIDIVTSLNSTPQERALLSIKLYANYLKIMKANNLMEFDKNRHEQSEKENSFVSPKQLLFNSPILDDSSSSQYISNSSRKIQSTNTSKILQQAINLLQHNSDSTQSSTQQGEQNSCNSNDGYFDEKEQEVDLSDLLSVVNSFDSFSVNENEKTIEEKDNELGQKLIKNTNNKDMQVIVTLCNQKDTALKYIAIKNNVMSTISMLTSSYKKQLEIAKESCSRSYCGKSFNSTYVARNDYKYLEKKNIEDELPSISLQLLLDCSGSMDGIKINKVRIIATIIAEFCNNCDIPLSIIGHSWWANAVDIKVAKKFNQKDNSNILQLNADGGNRDGQAIRIACNNLMTQKTDYHILMLLSDGSPSAYNSFELAKNDIELARQYCKKNNVMLIAGAFDDDKARIKSLYKDSYLCIDSLQELPLFLMKKIKNLITK